MDFREKRRDRERERNINLLPPVTRDQTCNLGKCPVQELKGNLSIHGRMLSQLSNTGLGTLISFLVLYSQHVLSPEGTDCLNSLDVLGLLSVMCRGSADGYTFGVMSSQVYYFLYLRNTIYETADDKTKVSGVLKS